MTAGRRRSNSNNLIDKVSRPLALFDSRRAIRKASVTVGAMTSSGDARLDTASAPKPKTTVHSFPLSQQQQEQQQMNHLPWRTNTLGLVHCLLPYSPLMTWRPLQLAPVQHWSQDRTSQDQDQTKSRPDLIKTREDEHQDQDQTIHHSTRVPVLSLQESSICAVSLCVTC